MAVTDGLRAHLDRLAPPTSGRVDESGVLLAGAAAGLLGWGGTQLLTWVDPTAAALAAGLWAVLVGAFSGLTVRHGPPDLRFSDAMFLWGAVNGAATALTVAGVAGLVPERLAFWTGWAAAATLGYAGTGGLLVRAGATDRGRSYLVSAAVALGVLVVGHAAFDVVAPVAFLLLGALHVVPLLFDARTDLPAAARGALLAFVVASLLGAGVAL